MGEMKNFVCFLLLKGGSDKVAASYISVLQLIGTCCWVWAVASPENQDASQLVCMRLSTVNIQTQTAFDLFDLHIIYIDFRSNEFNLLWFLISCVWHSLPQVQTNVGWNPFWPTTSIFNNYSNYSTTGHEISSNKLQCCSFLIAMILCPVLG